MVVTSSTLSNGSSTLSGHSSTLREGLCTVASTMARGLSTACARGTMRTGVLVGSEWSSAGPAGSFAGPRHRPAPAVPPGRAIGPRHRAAPAVPPGPPADRAPSAADHSAVPAMRSLRCPVSPLTRRVMHRGTRVAVGAWSVGQCRGEGGHRLDRPRLATGRCESDSIRRGHVRGSRARASAIRVQRRMIGHKSGAEHRG